MTSRKPDIIRVDTENGSFDRFESIELVNDLSGPAEASFGLGDDGAWRELDQMIRPGQLFDVYVNDRLRIRGRAESNEAQGSPDGGVRVTLVVRTKLMDARYASANPATKTSGTTIKDFILALYRPLGFKEKDFLFSEATARDLMTGKSKGGKAPVDLAPLQADKAKVQPPESIFDAAERHLKRHHLMQWDSGDGRIVIGAPDAKQAPQYRLLSKRGEASVANNIGSFRRTRDWSEVPSRVIVYGGTNGKDFFRASIRGVVRDAELLEVYDRNSQFKRHVLVPAESVKTVAEASGQALREYAQRIRRKDAWEITTDGWAFWNGSESVTWAINTTADVDVETVGGPAGRYFISRVVMKASNDEKTTTLTMSAPEAWVI